MAKKRSRAFKVLKTPPHKGPLILTDSHPNGPSMPEIQFLAPSPAMLDLLDLMAKARQQVAEVMGIRSTFPFSAISPPTVNLQDRQRLLALAAGTLTCTVRSSLPDKSGPL